MKIGIVGTGYFGGEIARFLQHDVDGATVVAVFDPEFAEPISQELGCRTASSAEELCRAEDVDAVVVASPNWAHREAVVAAARAGKPVFCEKPIDLSSDRVEATLGVVQDAGVALMIGFNRRFDPNFAALQRRLREGALATARAYAWPEIAGRYRALLDEVRREIAGDDRVRRVAPAPDRPLPDRRAAPERAEPCS